MVANNGTARSMEDTIFLGAKGFHKIQHPCTACIRGSTINSNSASPSSNAEA